MSAIKEFFSTVKEVALVFALLAVPIGFLVKLAIAQEVERQNAPIKAYIQQDIQNTRDQILIAEWSACMQYATGYPEGKEREARCNLERTNRRELWRFEDCERDYGIGAEACVPLEPEPIPARQEAP